MVTSCKRGDSRERLLIPNPYRAFENYQSSYHRRRAAYANCCGVERLNGKLLDSSFFFFFFFCLLASPLPPHAHFHIESLFPVSDKKMNCSSRFEARQDLKTPAQLWSTTRALSSFVKRKKDGEQGRVFQNNIESALHNVGAACGVGKTYIETHSASKFYSLLIIFPTLVGCIGS